MTLKKIQKLPHISSVDKETLSNLIDIHEDIKKMPPLSSVERVKLENAIAIDQLYYSSRLEGSRLTKQALEKAIYGETF